MIICVCKIIINDYYFLNENIYILVIYLFLQLFFMLQVHLLSIEIELCNDATLQAIALSLVPAHLHRHSPSQFGDLHKLVLGSHRI